MIHLLIGLYDEPIESRFDEIHSCLSDNLALFSSVTVFLEDELAQVQFAPLLGLCDQVPLGHRLTFADALAYPGGPDDIYVLANNDIAFDTTITALDEIKEREFWCLTRHDDGKLYGCPDHSQDAWVWRPPIYLQDIDFPLGVLGCDGRIAFEARRAGYKLRNPSNRVILTHRHASKVRRNQPRLQGGYAYVPAEK